MAGRRLLDVAALFNASRGIAQKHIVLRSRQLEVYGKTSSLARALKSQTDRITETAKAASFLASRLNETAPAWASEAEESSVGGSKQHAEPTTSPRNTESVTGFTENIEKGRSGSESTANSTEDVATNGELDIRQETADRNPLPDGTIPPSESSINKLEIDKELISKISKETARQPVGDLYETYVERTSSSQSTIPTPKSKPLSPEKAKSLQRQSEQQIPSNTADALDGSALVDGRDADTFYTPSGHTSPTLSSLPRVKIPKHTEDRQGSISQLKDGEINSDTFYTTKADKVLNHVPQSQAVPEQEQISEDINTDVFYSPRVAKLLGGKTHLKKKSDLHLKASAETPIDHTSLAQGRDQDTFYVHSSTQEVPSPAQSVSSNEFDSARENANHDIKKLAEDIANDSNLDSATTLDVSYTSPIIVYFILITDR